MMRQRGGSIINMSSVVGVSGNAGQCNYSASKAGMIGLAKSTAKELGSRGIRANCIAPGFILTDMTMQLSEEVRKQWTDTIPLRRGGTPEDVANVATFLIIHDKGTRGAFFGRLPFLFPASSPSTCC